MSESEADVSDFIRFPRLDPRRAMTRFAFSLLAGLLTFVALWPFKWPVRFVASWDVLSLIQITFGWWIIATSSTADTRRLARSENPGRALVGLVVMSASFVNLFLAIYLLRHAKNMAMPHGVEVALTILCVIAVACSWFLTHTTYGAHYVHLYYAHNEGLDFPGKREPDAWDFAYFSFTLGMCFQTSDVSISSPKIRRVALIHQLISFTYNTAILALAINMIIGLLS